MTISMASVALFLSLQAPTSDTAESVSKGELPPESEVICKKTSVAGTRFKRRMCATQEEWDELARRSAETTRELKGNRGSTKGG